MRGRRQITGLDPRQRIVKHLTAVRDTASGLVEDLGREAVRAGGRSPVRVEQFAKRKRRTLSAAARKAISDAQKKRWAAVKAAKKK